MQHGLLQVPRGGCLLLHALQCLGSTRSARSCRLRVSALDCVCLLWTACVCSGLRVSPLDCSASACTWPHISLQGWWGHDCAYQTANTTNSPGKLMSAALRGACGNSLWLAHTGSRNTSKAAACGLPRPAPVPVPAGCPVSRAGFMPSNARAPTTCPRFLSRHGGEHAALAQALCADPRCQGPEAWGHPEAPAHIHASTRARTHGCHLHEAGLMSWTCGSAAGAPAPAPYRPIPRSSLLTGMPCLPASSAAPWVQLRAASHLQPGHAAVPA